MNNNIWSPKIMGNRACCKIPYKGYEISIAMDDSCGAFDTYSRSSIRIFRDYDGKDVTEEFYKHDYGNCVASADNLKYIFCHIDMFGHRDARHAAAELAIKADERIEELENALQKIAAIEDQLFGGDWEEIEQARDIANAVLSPAFVPVCENANMSWRDNP